MASTRITPANMTDGNYQTYWARRPNAAGVFAAPVPISELDYRDRSTVDAFLTDDRLTMFFSSTPALASEADGGGQDGGQATSADLYVAFRRTTDEAFATTQALTDLNTSFDERDPWLSPDGSLLYFSSERDGELNIYRVPVLPR